MMEWADKAAVEIESLYYSGEITDKEYLKQMRDLRSELREYESEPENTDYILRNSY